MGMNALRLNLLQKQFAQRHAAGSSQKTKVAGAGSASASGATPGGTSSGGGSTPGGMSESERMFGGGNIAANVKLDTSQTGPTYSGTGDLPGTARGNVVRQLITGPDGKVTGYIGMDGNFYPLGGSETRPLSEEKPPQSWRRTYETEPVTPAAPATPAPPPPTPPPVPPPLPPTPPAQDTIPTEVKTDVTPAALAERGITRGASGFERSMAAGLNLPSAEQLSARFLDEWRKTRAGPKTEAEAQAWAQTPEMQRIFQTGQVPDYMRKDPRMRLLLARLGLLNQ